MTIHTLGLSSNDKKSVESIEVPPESLSKTENVKENKEMSSSTVGRKCWIWMKLYGKKFQGLHEERPNRLPWQEYLWSFIGAFLGIASVAFLHFRLVQQQQLVFLIGSFGASAVIIFGAPRSPTAQPRNLICGNLIGALCGCVVRVAIDRFEHSIACALAVALAILIMQLTESMHPPGGATALIAVTSQQSLPWANFLFILMPVLTGSIVLLLVALIINNMASRRTYPSFWW